MEGGRRAKPSGSKKQVVRFLEMIKEDALVPMPITAAPGAAAGRQRVQHQAGLQLLIPGYPELHSKTALK